MSTLSEKFAAARDIIFDNRHKENDVHIIVDIMRAANRAAGVSGTDYIPENLHAVGIDPVEFRTAWAIDYAYKTLVLYDRNGLFSSTVVNRCRICLATDGEYDFGHFLSEEMKNQLREKLEINLPHAAKKQLQPD